MPLAQEASAQARADDAGQPARASTLSSAAAGCRGSTERCDAGRGRSCERAAESSGLKRTWRGQRALGREEAAAEASRGSRQVERRYAEAGSTGSSSATCWGC